MGNNLITGVCCTFHQPTKVSVGKNTLESLRSQFFLATSHALCSVQDYGGEIGSVVCELSDA